MDEHPGTRQEKRVVYRQHERDMMQPGEGAGEGEGEGEGDGGGLWVGHSNCVYVPNMKHLVWMRTKEGKAG
jgi:hypothetical protein